MQKYLVVVALLFVALGAPAALRADESYNVNFSVGSNTVTGTIDTDGITGTLTSKDLLSYSFGVTHTISPGITSTTDEAGTTAAADIAVTGDALTATASGLFFNFSSTDPSSLVFLEAENTFLLCLFANEGCDPAGGGEILTLGAGTLTITGLTGNQMLASAPSVGSMPEPGTLGLMLIGLVGLAFLSRKRFARGLRLDAGERG